MKHLHIIWCTILFPAVLLTVDAGGRQEEAPADSESGTEIELDEPTDTGEQQLNPEPAEPGSAEEPERGSPIWVLADHQLEETIEREISGLVADGYTPVGMETTEDGISVLYLRTDEVLFDRWIIHEFTELDNLNSEMSDFLVEGWLPTGFSKNGDSITTLFIRAEETAISGWRIHDVPAGDLEQLVSVSEAYIEEGYVPYGISVDESDNRIWLLLLETPTNPTGGERANLLVNGFENANITEGITRDIEQGAVPWGMSREREVSFFLYLF